MKALLTGLCWMALAGASATAQGADVPVSECHGTTSNGHLRHGVALPLDGPNYSAYTSLTSLLGRNFLHSTVAAIVIDAYATLADIKPGLHFVYGETGARNGGPFKPHRTHQNGTSVDFFMPVRNGAGRSVALPTGIGNRYGYDIEFDADGRYGDYQIDFAALAEHLHRLHAAAARHRSAIALVIIDVRYLPKLFATPRGNWLKQNVRFMQRDAWVRHDEHYHVDFSVRCKPLSALRKR